ncbi:hypothetical protein OROGR_030822 [Orobanche gracilis]
MNPSDIKNRLVSESIVCLHKSETCFHISTLKIDDPEIGYYIFETIPGHVSYGGIKKFPTLDAATEHFQRVKELDAKYVLKPEGQLCRNNVKENEDRYMLRYMCVFETLDDWRNNFHQNQRSDDDLLDMYNKIGGLLKYRYDQTGCFCGGAIGDNIFKNIIITDDKNVLFLNWPPTLAKKKFKNEIRTLRYLVQELNKLATSSRFESFVTFLTKFILVNPQPPTEMGRWLFHYPALFMNEQQGVRFLESVNKILCDKRTGVSVSKEFILVQRDFDNWQTDVVSSGDIALIQTLRFNGGRNYNSVFQGIDLPKFGWNCVKHYSQNAAGLNLPELTQVEIVRMLNMTHFQHFMETSFEGIYQCMLDIATRGRWL